MKILASIAARGGSKGVPGKNLKLLNGKPLISYMIEAAKRSQLIDRVILSTDDMRIKETGEHYGAEAPFMRTAGLSGDDVPLIAVTRNTMESMDKLGFKADIIVQLSPTCPFITTTTIDASINCILNGVTTCSVTLKRIEHEHPYRAKQLVDKQNHFRSFIKDVDVEKYQQRQSLPELYCTSGAVYTRRRHLLENWSGEDFCLGENPAGIVLNDVEAINIDRPIDFVYAEFVMSNREKLIRDRLLRL